MARSPLILPRADSNCGKAFFGDRRTADGHRVALEFWNRATGYRREGYQLAVYRCKRCGGFHVGQKRVLASPVRTHDIQSSSPEPSDDGRRLAQS